MSHYHSYIKTPFSSLWCVCFGLCYGELELFHLDYYDVYLDEKHIHANLSLDYEMALAFSQDHVEC